jgi:hypothetical protein
MLDFDVIKLGLEVEFQIEEKIFDGFVRYKGPINGKDGLWIGIEANEASKKERHTTRLAWFINIFTLISLFFKNTFSRLL